MRTRPLMLSMTLAAFAAAPALAMAQSPPATMTKPQVEQRLQAEGYTKAHDVNFDDGLWQAEATSADGKDVDVTIDPNTGKVMADKAVSQVGEDDIRASLSSAGYSDAHDIDFDDGIWKARARNANGDKVKLRLSPEDAGIIAVEAD